MRLSVYLIPRIALTSFECLETEMNSKLRQEWETEMRTAKLVNKYKKKHKIKESQIEVDNGFHPLHWATSPGPSPMGTNPINLFKMVQKWF